MSDSDDGSDYKYNGDMAGNMGTSDYSEMPMQSEEHLWIAKLSKENPIVKFEGCDDAESSLLLRRATLSADCKDTGRHVIQIISLDHDDNRIEGTLCSLTLDKNCSISLDAISCSPPSALKLVKGDGPLTLIGNLMKEVDPCLLDEEQSSDEEILAEDAEKTEVDSKIIKKIENRLNAKKASNEMEDDGSDDSDENESDDSNGESKPLGPSPKKGKVTPVKKPAGSPKNAVATSAKVVKRKNSEESEDKSEADDKENSNPMNKKQKIEVKAKVDSDSEKKGKDEKDKKPVREPIKSAKELIEAIKASKGGRPKKKEKFTNWIKHTFKVDKKDFVEKAWAEFN